MKTTPTLCIISLALVLSQTSNAALFVLSGSMDPLQAGSNGGFGGGTGSGIGSISGSYDDSSNLFSYNISWSGFSSSVTNMHFHLGDSGVSGGVALGIPGPWTSPVTGDNTALNATQESQLLAGDWYVNVHTASFPAGEIRGQVNVSPIPEPSSALLLGLGALALVSTRRDRTSRSR